MVIVGWIIWTAALLLGLSFVHGVRRCVRTGQGVQQATVNQTMLIIVAVAAVPLLGLSPFHILWMLPLAFVIGMMSLAFPFSLVSLLGRPFGVLCCIGLNRAEVARNEERAERYRELVLSGMAPEEAREKLLGEDDQD